MNMKTKGRLLPDGHKSKDNFLFTAKIENKTLVGFLWFCIRSPEGNQRAFVYDVIIKDQYRGQGFGRQIMFLAEQKVKSLGVDRIGLHVFGFNEVAIGLYKSLGYETTDLVMEKSLL